MNQVILPLRRALALLTFSLTLLWMPANAQAEALCSLDIDGDGQMEALTDGLLITRHLFGFVDAELIHDAIGNGAIRNTAAQITAYLQQPDCQAMLDVDGNGTRDALTDGFMIIRFLSGLSGDALTSGAPALGVRTDAGSIAEHISYYGSERQEVIPEQVLLPGEEIQTPDGVAKLRNEGNVPLQVQLIQGTDLDGVDVYEVSSNGPVVLILPDPNGAAAARSLAQGRLDSQSVAVPKSDTHPQYAISEYWRGGNAYFLTGIWNYDGVPLITGTAGIEGYNRFPGSGIRRSVMLGYEWITLDLPTEATTTVLVKGKPAWALESTCPPNIDNVDCEVKGKEPVLFIHGFMAFSVLGGGEGTWGDFPRLVQDADYLPFEFKWNSAARFQDVARNLRQAIDVITTLTGREVHLVAHSFGGLLVRTLIQGWRVKGDESGIENLLASLTTLGTPHSGIFDNYTCRGGEPFPGGQDTYM